MKGFLTKLGLGALLLLLAPGLAFAQQGTITGTITDSETGDPLPGATVQLVELGRGTATSVSGQYSIEDVEAGSYTLRATFIGYQRFEADVNIEGGETVTRDIELSPDRLGLDEVVVTGIASERSRARTDVSVSRVDANQQLEENNFQNVSQLIGGKVSGVNVQPSSGNVGGGLRFVVRGGAGLNGDGQPVIYVDGVRIDQNEFTGDGAGGQGFSTLAELNPEDIESIEILKGPAGAAIYGTEGANGVVLITTKTGSFTEAFQLNYKGTYGQNQRAFKYDEADYTTASDANAIFRDGDIQQHVVSARGGTEAFNYFSSVTYRDEEGHLPNNSGQRTSFRANFEAVPTEKVNLSANANYVIAENQRPQNDNNTFGFLGNTLLLPSSYVFLDSTSIRSIEDVQEVNRFIGSFSASYRPISNLELRATAGYDGSSRRADQTYPLRQDFGGLLDTGYRTIFNRINNQWNGNASIRYNYNITDDLQATSILGTQVTQIRRLINDMEAATFATGLITDINAGSNIQEADEAFLQSRTAGIFTQHELSYKDTYFFTGVLRQDYATQFGEDTPSIFYPAIRGAVRLDQLDFTPDSFDLLKVRAAFGQNGILPGITDGELVRYAAASSGYGGGAVPTTIGNPEIVPERISEFETGVDAEISRVSLEGTYFRTWASDSIIDLEEAPSTGFALPRFGGGTPQNVGGISTQGVELALGVTPYQTRSNEVSLNFTYTYQTSEVTDLGGSPPLFGGFDLNVIQEGLPRGAFYPNNVVTGPTFNDDGTYAGPSFAVGEDPRSREAVEGGRKFQGIPSPEHYGGIRLNVRLFNDLSISGLAEYAMGHQVFNNTELFASQDLIGLGITNSPERNRALRRLGLISDTQIAIFGQAFGATPEDLGLDGVEAVDPGTDAYRQAAEVAAFTDPRFDSNFIEDADYLKLREISLRYDATDLLQKAGVSGVRNLTLGISARNLLTLSGYTNVDPEVNFDGSRSLIRGQDFLTLASPRQYFFTISVGV